MTRPDDLSPSYGIRENHYHLSPTQAQAILDLRLHRLTGLEIEKIHEEYETIVKAIAELIYILSDPDRLHEVIRNELLEVKKEFGDKRRTEIIGDKQDFTTEDLITEEEMVVTLSHAGYVKSQSLSSYEAQHRGGRGKMATAVKEQDFVKNILVANTHDTILCFSTKGKVYWLKVYQVPQGGRVARGRPVINLLPLEQDEAISAILPIKDFNEKQYVFMATMKGTVKKVPLNEFSLPRTKGKLALALGKEDQLIGVDLTDGKKEIMLLSDAGKAIRFHEEAVRPMGRSARGVRGIKMEKKHRLIALIVAKQNGTILAATEKGYGQRTELNDYRATGRGGQGVMAIRVSERNGKVVAATQVFDDDEVLLISNYGTLVRTRVNEISVIGRNTQGVRLIQLSPEESLVGVEAISAELGGVVTPSA